MMSCKSKEDWSSGRNFVSHSVDTLYKIRTEKIYTESSRETVSLRDVVRA